ncbi:MAG: nodulation protein NfeD, partial [Cyclobacteriaceae bacterium]|nr:nodulation protein NfeD [Cyclobacteriaceae bacterium]
VEIFVFPGFGVAGISGISLTVISLILIMINNDSFDFQFVPANEILYAVAATFGGMLGGIALLFIGGAKFSETKFFKRVALTDTQDRGQGFTVSAAKESLKGKSGTAYTVLRPGGKVMIDGQLYDAYTRGEYLDKGDGIIVLDDETTSIRVKKYNG